MISTPPVALPLRTPEGQSEYDQQFKDVRAMLLSHEQSLVTQRYIALEWEFDQCTTREQAELLGNALMWTDEDQQFSLWIHDQYVKLADLGKCIAEMCEKSAPEGDPVTAYVVARALAHYGNALKWELIAGRVRERQDFGPVHSLYRIALAAGSEQVTECINREGVPIQTTAQGLFLRVFLLDRFCSGNLNRQQVEILDSWLWAWLPNLQAARAAPDSASLRIDLDTKSGLCFGSRSEEGESLYLALKPLHALSRRAINEFHLGKIFPGHGCTASFRVEEHVAALDYLDTLLAQLERGCAPVRARRSRKSGMQVEIFIGLEEIMRRAFKAMAPTSMETTLPAFQPLTGSRRADETAGRLNVYEADRRYLVLHDQSDSGLGLECDDQLAGKLGVGELIAVVLPDEAEPRIGEVVRIVPAKTGDRVLIGVNLRFADAQPVSVHCTASTHEREVTAIYVPGDDNSGRRDALLVSEVVLQQRPNLAFDLAGKTYDLLLNRIRHKGRGWVAAGFEIVDVRTTPQPGAAVSESPPVRPRRPSSATAPRVLSLV